MYTRIRKLLEETELPNLSVESFTSSPENDKNCPAGALLPESLGTVLITGAAGTVGFALANYLLAQIAAIIRCARNAAMIQPAQNTGGGGFARRAPRNFDGS